LKLRDAFVGARASGFRSAYSSPTRARVTMTSLATGSQGRGNRSHNSGADRALHGHQQPTQGAQRTVGATCNAQREEMRQKEQLRLDQQATSPEQRREGSRVMGARMGRLARRGKATDVRRRLCLVSAPDSVVSALTVSLVMLASFHLTHTGPRRQSNVAQNHRTYRHLFRSTVPWPIAFKRTEVMFSLDLGISTSGYLCRRQRTRDVRQVLVGLHRTCLRQ
jgi:hypothetical protein